jgi:hypothetical protein
MTPPDFAPDTDAHHEHIATELEARELGAVAGVAMQQPDVDAPTADSEPTESAAEVELRFEDFMRRLYFAKGEAFFDSAVATFNKLNAGDMQASHRSDSQKEVMRRYAKELTSPRDEAD